MLFPLLIWSNAELCLTYVHAHTEKNVI